MFVLGIVGSPLQRYIPTLQQEHVASRGAVGHINGDVCGNGDVCTWKTR